MELQGATSVSRVFDLVMEIEIRCRDIYRDFSRMFSHESVVSSFWNDMGKDEQGHMDALHNLYQNLSEDELNRVADPDMYRSADQVLSMLRHFSPDQVENLNEAYLLAHALEYSEVNQIFAMVLNKLIPVARQGEFVDETIELHRRRLSSFGKECCQVRERKKIKPQLFH